jgi:hypothetical protein
LLPKAHSRDLLRHKQNNNSSPLKVIMDQCNSSTIMVHHKGKIKASLAKPMCN